MHFSFTIFLVDKHSGFQIDVTVSTEPESIVSLQFKYISFPFFKVVYIK